MIKRSLIIVLVILFSLVFSMADSSFIPKPPESPQSSSNTYSEEMLEDTNKCLWRS